MLNDKYLRRTTKRIASLKQIHAAIKHMQGGDYECSITLACAAEGQIASREELHFWDTLKLVSLQSGMTEKEFVSIYNETRDWLKHPTVHLDGDRLIHRDEAVIACLRAVMKFRGAFRQSSSRMNDFMRFAQKNGFLEKDYPHKYDAPSVRP